MGLFNKKNKKEGKTEKQPIKLPELPKLSKLPDLPKLPESETKLPQLPRYPSTKLGDKFSQSMIKENVTGEKEDEIRADEFVKEQMMPLSQKIKPSKLKPEFPSKIEKINPRKKPVFIRIDKFEESLKIFEDTKEKIYSMEKLLSEIKQLKEMEDRELSDWGAEIQTIKNQIEKVERDIFSKIE